MSGPPLPQRWSGPPKPMRSFHLLYILGGSLRQFFLCQNKPSAPSPLSTVSPHPSVLHILIPVQLLITRLSQQELYLWTGTARSPPSNELPFSVFQSLDEKTQKNKASRGICLQEAAFDRRHPSISPMAESGVYSKSKNGHVCSDKLGLEKMSGGLWQAGRKRTVKYRKYECCLI